MTAAEIIARLGMKPLPVEGGYFAETYRSSRTFDGRPAGTAIYYLLTPDTFSALHRLRSDEVFHFYRGDPVRQLQLGPDGTGREFVLGSDLSVGQLPQLVVSAGVWQGSVLEPGGHFALMGTTMAPGFDFADFQAGDRAELTTAYPAFAGMIRRLT